MLGISAGLEQRAIGDFKTPADYISYLFTGIRGWICRGQLSPYYQQSMYRFNGLMKQDFAGEENVYISMNTFFVNERTTDKLKRLNALYVDIDCYKQGLSKAAVLDELEADYFESVIPTPTFVIDSGRGLYLVWKLRNEDRNALPRWERVQNYLIETLKELGADPACRDSARILRIPFSRNTKSGTDVEILRFTDATYSLAEIQQEFDIMAEGKYRRADGEKTHPYNTATEPMRRYALQLALKLGVTTPNFNNFQETQEWIAKMRLSAPCRPHSEEEAAYIDPKQDTKLCRILEGYCNDIEILFSMRKGEDCKREIALFLYRLFSYDLTRDKELALERTLAFNAALSCPFPEKYVIRATNSAEKKIDSGDTYHYKRGTIIETLEITGEEMKSLTYLVGQERRRERKKETNRKAYLDRLAAAGKETKAEAKEKRRSALIAMQQEGKSAQEIMEALSISRATYYREIAAITAENVLEAARDVLEENVEKIAQTAEKAAEAILATAEKTEETLHDTVETVLKLKGGRASKQQGNYAPGAVSKIHPYNYERIAKQCRTAPEALSDSVSDWMCRDVPIRGIGGVKPDGGSG